MEINYRISVPFHWELRSERTFIDHIEWWVNEEGGNKEVNQQVWENYGL
jgi:hypothetical protein